MSIFLLFQVLLSTRVILVDKDYNQIKLLREEFPHARVLLCAIHVIKAFKNRLAKENLSVEEKNLILDAFKQVLYSKNEDIFVENQTKMKNLCSQDLAAYYSDNWEDCSEMW